MLFTAEFLARHWRILLPSALVLVLLCGFISLSFGAVALSFTEVFNWALGRAEVQEALILGQLRLPRTLLTTGVGAMLALAGAVTQGLFRNPLADPSLIGVSAGASVGASVVIVLTASAGESVLGLSMIALGAFVGGSLAVVLVYRIATGITGTSVASMLLAGIAVTFFAGSISGILEFVADSEMLRRISLWRMGGLEGANYGRAVLILAVFILLAVWLSRDFDALNALLLGESEARHLGVDVDVLKSKIIVCVAAGVGVSVAVAGTIAFVGLIVPHIVRMLVGPNHRFLIPLSACLGAVLMLLADTFARTIMAPTELPVGLITAFIGAPVFILLLRHRHHYGMQ